MARRYLQDFDVGAHSKYLMYGHLVIVTKYRYKILTEDLRRRVIALFTILGKRHGVTIEQAKGDADHIHFLLRYKPTTNIPKFIGSAKSFSSRVIREENSELRKIFTKSGIWSPSYCLLTTGGAPIDIIRRYIERQGKKGRNHDD